MFTTIGLEGCSKADDSSDGSDLSFLSEVYSIDKAVNSYWLFEQGDSVRLIVQTTDTIDNSLTDNYYLYTISNGEISDSIELDIDSTGAFCAVGDDRIACLYIGGGYRLFDVNGNMIREYIGDSTTGTGHSDIERSSEGFVTLSTNQIILYDYEGNIMGEIDPDEVFYLSEETSYFERDGKKYLSVETLSATTAYYELDFDDGTYSFAGDNTNFGLESDMTTYRYGGYVYDEVNGLLGSLNFNNYSIDTIALLEYCIIAPPEYLVSSNIHTHILSDKTFAKVYRYDAEQTDVVLVKSSENTDLTSRTRLTIQGQGMTDDITLMWAVYLYNIGQEEYLICLDDYSDRYYYTNAQEAQEAKLRLLASYEAGDTPDIFYGNDFDYDYWGRSGAVVNIRDYCGDELFEDLIPSARDIMISNDKCYHIFAGFVLFGFVGAEELYDKSDYPYDNLPPLEDYQSRWPEISSVDLADMMIRYAITAEYSMEDILKAENIEAIVRTAIEEGTDPSQPSIWGENYGLAEHQYSLYLAYVPSDIRLIMYGRTAIAGNLSFVGFPSVGRAYHDIIPYSNLAISSNTEHVEACIDFIRILFSEEVQSKNYMVNLFPISQTILDQYLEYMKSPESIPSDEHTYISMATTTYSQLDESGYLSSYEGYIEPAEEDINNYIELVNSIDTITCVDWGIYNIINEEIQSYYSTGKSIEAIAESLTSRLSLYYQENYG